MSRWQRYWFAEGGRLGVAVLRVAIALAVWLVLRNLEGTWPANAPGAPEPPDVYRPVGLWMLFGGEPPSNGVIDVLWVIAKLSTVAMLVGLFSRAATAVSFASALALGSLYYSGFPSWSHAHNAVFLAQLAFLGSRCGDALSVDALIRELRGRPAVNHDGSYQWSIRLVQLAVAVMFASGMFHKVMQGGFTLDWALSDNLRHQLLVRFDVAHQERTALASWIIDDVWRYRSAALLNLIAQTMPLLACVFVRRPVWRAAFGTFFVVETLALGLVMDLWNLQWLPLAVVFVDWDALVARLWPGRTAPAATAAVGPRRHRVATAFIIAFVAYDLITAFVPRLDRRLNTYPFSGFPMFASIRARKPYDQHQPYSFASGHFEIVSAEPVPDEVYRWIDHAYRRTFTVRRRDELRERLTAILADAQRWHAPIQGLRCYYAIYEAAAYPAPAKLERHTVGLLGEVFLDGTFRSMLGTARADGAEVVLTPGAPAPPNEPVGAIEIYADERLPATRAEQAGGAAWRVTRPKAKKVAYVAVTRQDGREQRWLVATTPR